MLFMKKFLYLWLSNYSLYNKQYLIWSRLCNCSLLSLLPSHQIIFWKYIKYCYLKKMLKKYSCYLPSRDFSAIFEKFKWLYVQGWFKVLPELLDKLSANLERTADRTAAKKFLINVSKNNCTIIESLFYIHCLKNLKTELLPFHHETVPIVSSVRSLRVILDPRLNRQEHSFYISK